MKTRYSAVQVLKHLLLYPLRHLLPIRSREPLWRAILERQNSVPLYLVLARGHTAVQIGTPNVHTIRRYSRLVGRGGRVLVVEADPDNAHRLTLAAAKLRHDNVTIVNAGAWSSETSMTLRRSPDYDGDHRFDVEGVFVDNDLRTEFTSSVEVGMRPLDDILVQQGIDTVNYLCVTVNGAELEVLKGAERLLRSATDLRVFSKGHARVGSSDNEEALNDIIRAHLESRGFNAVVSRGEMSPTGIDGWGARAGDVFGWKRVEAVQSAAETA